MAELRMAEYKDMKVLIISDSHGRNDLIYEVLEKEKKVDCLIHLGDVENETAGIQSAAGCPCYFVAGNCDYSHELPERCLINMNGHTVYMTHGHRQKVQFSLHRLELAAAEEGADIAMYGHTHVPLIDRNGAIDIINPGSIARPRQADHKRTYMIMNINRDGFVSYELKELAEN